MLFEIYLRSELLSNNSETHGFVWDHFNFELCNDLEQGMYLWGFCAVLCFAFGFPASVAILVEMFKIHRRGTAFTPNDFFILNLAIMDAIFLFFIPPGLLNDFVWKIWQFESIWNGIYALNQSGRPFLMACVCLDCYLAVVHPITYRKRKSLKPRIVMAGIVWTLTIGNGIIFCLFFKLYWSMFPVMPFIIAILIIGICDSFILHTLIKSSPGRINIHPQKQRAIQTLINSLVIAVISYLPPVIMFAIGNSMITSFKIFLCTVGIPTTITSTSGSAVMPILYLNNIGKLDRFRLGCCRKS